MYIYVKIIIFVIVTFVSSLSAIDVRNRRKRSTNGFEKSRNYDMCQRVFDVSNATIIKATESIKNGARHLGTIQANSREACERSCCSWNTCNVAVMERNLRSTASDCFLFDCGTLDDFKCIFAVHSNYVALGMMVNRGDLEKTRIHEQAKHEMDLKILKTPPGQQPDTATTSATLNGQENRPPSSRLQQWSDPQENRFTSNSGVHEVNQKIPSLLQDPNGVAQNGYGGMSRYDGNQRQQLPPQNVMENGDSSNRYQAIPNRFVAQNGKIGVQDTELQRKRPPIVNTFATNGNMGNPKSLINANIQQPQRPPLTPQNGDSQVCGAYQWRCLSGDQCIAIYDRCSGITQCADGSDEMNCDQPVNQENNVNWNTGGSSVVQNGQPLRQQQQNPSMWKQPPSTDDQMHKSGYVSGNGGDYGLPRQQFNQQGTGRAPSQNQPMYQSKGYYRTNQQVQFKQPQAPNIIQSSNPSSGTGTSFTAPEFSTNKQSGVEFISIQKLDSSASTSGGEGASLAVVTLGLGMVMLAIFLLYISCRLRKIRRRLRRGKVLDTEEGEYLVNDMYL